MHSAFFILTDSKIRFSIITHPLLALPSEIFTHIFITAGELRMMKSQF